jgi:hypothetical protein
MKNRTKSRVVRVRAQVVFVLVYMPWDEFHSDFTQPLSSNVEAATHALARILKIDNGISR